MGDAKTHHALILVWLLLSKFVNGLTTTQLTRTPTGLTAPVSE
jgi:hypothetical protein